MSRSYLSDALKFGCGDIWQIWMWFKILTRAFARSKIPLMDKSTNGALLTSIPGARPTNAISIDFEIRSKCAVLWITTEFCPRHDSVPVVTCV